MSAHPPVGWEERHGRHLPGGNGRSIRTVQPASGWRGGIRGRSQQDGIRSRGNAQRRRTPMSSSRRRRTLHSADGRARLPEDLRSTRREPTPDPLLEDGQIAARRRSNRQSESNPKSSPAPDSPAGPIRGSCPSSRGSMPLPEATGRSVGPPCVVGSANRSRSLCRRERPVPVGADGEGSDGTAGGSRSPRGPRRARGGPPQKRGGSPPRGNPRAGGQYTPRPSPTPPTKRAPIGPPG